MTLRLNSSSNINSSGISSSSSLRLLQTFEHDVNLSATVKAEAFKFLSVILSNLVNHPLDDKFRQLRMSNAKIQRLTAHETVRSFLQDIMGFAAATDATTDATADEIWKIPDARLPSESVLQTAHKEVLAARDRIERTLTPPPPSSKTFTASATGSSSNPTTDLPLTERQKVRQQARVAAAAEQQANANARKRTVALIQADQHVRANDANWKPSVAAAAAKAGDAMTTFRDKFGETD